MKIYKTYIGPLLDYAFQIGSKYSEKKTVKRKYNVSFHMVIKIPVKKERIH